MDNIFPKALMHSTSEVHFIKNQVSGKKVYILLILMVLLALISLPFIMIDITYATPGILKTSEEPSKISLSCGGRILKTNLRQNGYVEKGDTLLIIDYQAISAEIKANEELLDRLKLYMHDLNSLLSGSGIIKTQKYQGVQNEFKNRMAKLQSEFMYLEDTYLTNRELYEEGFIPRLEYESQKRKYLSEKAMISLEADNYHNRWQNELMQHQLKRSELITRNTYLNNNLQNHIIVAPVSGSLADYQDIQPGSYVSERQVIGRIIPNMELVATCFIPTDKIARIRIGQPIKLAIDSYPALAHGYVYGEVSDIQKDVSIVSNTPGFPVRCNILKTMRNKKQGNIKLTSGMTFTGMFILSRKSLLMVIIEKSSELVTPSTETVITG